MSQNGEEDRKRLSSSPLAIQAIMEMYDLRFNNPTMKASVFAQFVRTLYDPEKDAFNVEEWVKTVGKHRSPLNVVDDVDEKKILFIAPPVMGTVETTTDPRLNVLSRISDHAADQYKRHPLAGERAFNQGMQAFRPKGVISTREAWRRILQHYGLIAPDKTEQDTLPASDSSEDSSFINGQYEEF